MARLHEPQTQLVEHPVQQPPFIVRQVAPGLVLKHCEQVDYLGGGVRIGGPAL